MAVVAQSFGAAKTALESLVQGIFVGDAPTPSFGRSDKNLVTRVRSEAKSCPPSQIRMTLEERHDFQAWQRTADELTTVERCLGLLAAFAVAEPEVVAEVLAHRPASPPSPESVLDDLARISARPPRGPHAQTRWITSVERVALAHRAAADPRLAASPQTRDLLAQALARFNPGAPVLWVSPLVASPAVRVEPWTSLRPATETQALCAETVDEDALAAWCEGELHPVDRATLRTWVLTDPWQRAYRALVREGLSDLMCMTWTPAWSLDVAHDEGERPSAATLIDLPLPHLGDGVRLRGRAFVGAVHFEVEGGSSPRRALVGPGDAFHLEDSVVGSIDAKPLFEEPSRLDDAWHGVASVRSLALGNERSSRSLEVAKAVSSSLESGTLLHGLKRAQDVFHSGADEDEASAWALAALEARLALEVLADRLDDPGLDEALERADAAAGPFGNGLLLSSDADWQNATHGCEIEPQCWWRVRARLDEMVPEQALLECLDDMAEVSEGSGTVVPFAKSAKPMPFSARDAGPSLYLAAASRELLSEYEGWEEPWKVLAHRMTRMIAVLGSRHLDDVIEHRVHAALAWTHAGELDQAKQVLDGLPESAEVSPALVCVRKVVELGTAIDEERLSDFAALREEILSIVGELRSFERRGVVGQAYGTMGRSFMHARDPATAQGWIERSIAHFQATPGLSHEVPRSRTYLVGSLRAQARWEEAQAELARAFEGVEHAKTESLTYALNTLMFLNYEAARLYLALDQADRALRAAREALARAELRGFWPRLGILRTMAWVYRLLDEHDEADRCVRVMEMMGVSQEHESLRHRLVDEASGSPMEDGEVY